MDASAKSMLALEVCRRNSRKGRTWKQVRPAVTSKASAKQRPLTLTLPPKVEGKGEGINSRIKIVPANIAGSPPPNVISANEIPVKIEFLSQSLFNALPKNNITRGNHTTEPSEARRFITEIIYPLNMKTEADKKAAYLEYFHSLIKIYVKSPAKKICTIMK